MQRWGRRATLRYSPTAPILVLYIIYYTSVLLSIPSTCQFCVLAVALQDAVRPGVRRKSFRQCSSVMKQSCCARQFVLAFFMSTLYLQLVRASTWRSLGDHLAITWSNNWSSLGVHLEATWRASCSSFWLSGGQVGAPKTILCGLDGQFGPKRRQVALGVRLGGPSWVLETLWCGPRSAKLSFRSAQEAPN